MKLLPGKNQDQPRRGDKEGSGLVAAWLGGPINTVAAMMNVSWITKGAKNAVAGVVVVDEDGRLQLQGRGSRRLAMMQRSTVAAHQSLGLSRRQLTEGPRWLGAA
ncbi:hypothetical protein IMZ48_25835 [Candidatus Bathyarchaeota archaeon]|nr:hypothetical protein [Candidatus Bathyarchaeota archaeon]